MEKITAKEIEKLGNCTNEEDWNNCCDEVQQNHGGNYPTDWYQEVVLSGLLNTTKSNFE